MKKKLLLLLCSVYTVVMYSQEYKFGKVTKEELQEKVYAKDSIADAVLLYNSRRTYYTYNASTGFNVITEVKQRIKIYTKKGFDYATFNINYYKPKNGDKERLTSIKGNTFNLVNGKIERTKLSKKSIFNERLNKYRAQTKITMPNIKEGAIVEIKYMLMSPFSSSIDDVQFQFNIPVKKFLCRIEIPEYLVFNQRMKGYFIVPLQKEFKTGRIGEDLSYTINVSKFEATDIPALRDNEPYISNIHNYRGGVKFELTSTKYPNSMLKFYTTTWKDVVKTIYKSPNFGNELEKTSYFKDELAALLPMLKTDEEKLIGLLQFVKKKVKWNGFNGVFTDAGVRKAFKEGVGNVADINLMLTAMLREAGLDAHPILSSTRSHGISFFPTREGFNYVMVGVKIKEKMIYLDASEKFSAPNILPLRTVNWKGRIIYNDKSSDWVSLTPSSYASDENYIAISFGEDMEVSGMMRTKYTNLYALNYRSRNNHLKEENIVETLENKYNVEIDNFKVTNEKNVLKPLVRTFKFAGEDLIEEINGKIYVTPLFFLASKINPFKLKERKFPIDYGVPLKDKNTISIKIPEGYSVASVPESKAIAIRDNIGVFKYKISASASKVVIVSQLVINDAVVTPEYYQELKEFYNQMVKKQTEKIIFVKA